MCALILPVDSGTQGKPSHTEKGECRGDKNVFFLFT